MQRQIQLLIPTPSLQIIRIHQSYHGTNRSYNPRSIQDPSVLPLSLLIHPPVFYFPALHLPSATVSNLTLFLPPVPTASPKAICMFTLSTPPASIQGCRLRHWETSKCSSFVQPSTTASTPVPVTRTQPRTLKDWRSRRWRPMERSEPSDTAEPQKARLR
jgi:hypothetical protein